MKTPICYKIIVLAAMFLILLPAVVFSYDNLLNNPSFSDGITGWSLWSTVDEEDVTVAQSGLGEIFYNTPPYSLEVWSDAYWDYATAGAWQNFSVSPSQSSTYYASSFLRSFSDEALRDGAEAWLALKWYDSNGAQLGDAITSPHLVSFNDEWQSFQVSGESPLEAVEGRIELRMYDPGMSGSLRSVYFDDVRVGLEQPTTVPEPVSTLLFISGGATLITRRFSRKNKK